MLTEVWIFNGGETGLPVAVFVSREQAEECIERLELSGLLTKYPVGITVYEWAEKNDLLPRKRSNLCPTDFTTGALEHYHYRKGKDEAAWEDAET
jgi:hypothetical protein